MVEETDIQRGDVSCAKSGLKASSSYLEDSAPKHITLSPVCGRQSYLASKIGYFHFWQGARLIGRVQRAETVPGTPGQGARSYFVLHTGCSFSSEYSWVLDVLKFHLM
jgi:hypothetical protein